MITLFFGLPGCGKTTMLVQQAIIGLKKYSHVYSNVPLKLEGVIWIDNECVGKYDFGDNSLILIDEASDFADSRQHRNMQQSLVSYMNQHRHYKVDIMFFNQGWDSLDIKIRRITNKVYYIYKSPILNFLFGVSSYYPVPYGILIPKKGDTSSTKYGEIVQGYYKPGLFTRLIAGGWINRKRYYKWFDSWYHVTLPPLPQQYIERSKKIWI